MKYYNIKKQNFIIIFFILILTIGFNLQYDYVFYFVFKNSSPLSQALTKILVYFIKLYSLF